MHFVAESRNVLLNIGLFKRCCLLTLFSARVIRPLGNKTVFRGIWLIILFVYKYVGDTVTTVLKCVALEGDEVERGTLVSSENVWGIV